jgi:hypothetical protein
MKAPMKPLTAFLLGTAAGAFGLAMIAATVFFWWYFP